MSHALPATPTRHRGGGVPWTALRELALFCGAYLAYFGVRGLVEGRVDVAIANAAAIVAFERSIGLFVEPAMQAAFAGPHWAETVAGWIYIWGHWPVIIAVGLWLFRTRRAAYILYRNAILLSGAAGLAFFASFPTAPPRLADLGLIDTVMQHAGAYRLLQPAVLTNQYAAFPSLHFGWNLLMGLALVREADRRSLRLIGYLTPVLMAIAVVSTANHFVVDAIAGGALALGALGLAGARTGWSRAFDGGIHPFVHGAPRGAAHRQLVPVAGPVPRSARHRRIGFRALAGHVGPAGPAATARAGASATRADRRRRFMRKRTAR